MAKNKINENNNETFSSKKRSDKNIIQMLAMQKSRESFDGYKKSTTGRMTIILGACLGLSLLCNIVQTQKTIPVKYVYADANGKISTLTAMNMPNMSDSEISNWIINALSNSLSFDYVQYRKQIQDSQQYFTPNGFVGFEKMLQTSHLLNEIIDQHLIMKSTILKAPNLTSSGDEGGVFVWHFSVPMSIELNMKSGQNNTINSSQKSVIVNVTIERLPETLQASAVGIARIFIEEN